MKHSQSVHNEIKMKRKKRPIKKNILVYKLIQPHWQKKKTIRKYKETKMSSLSLSHDIRSYNHLVCDNPSELNATRGQQLLLRINVQYMILMALRYLHKTG